MDIVTGIIILLAFLAIDIVLFLLLRQLVLWYFRINEIATNIAYIAAYYRRLETEPERTSRQPLPPLPLRENLTLEERARRLKGSSA